ncbi:tRNA (adenosine(37)-N6)-threonylcarbamoyltransferase complex ATPase subunit type 1 TsaE [Siansivirga zeaxanthinifaciens]|uniref:tRNA threonylcarbamoyladenosine biosynthesis protein TsaE n=1 Tax=Siansivirga zeaxanthinifaciens CC-SAMT-1 TaxID=1454006 RepID=A0A0C5WN50_9FLAO|nr:tRNA (adenosine(37)-N6)-threonylcarbamoyltransferase complex ATPase subunit type 1 TsaE [Siansivirga zeaxanthinifaciens]AJR04275.1 hydrolase [Siansivirga zeaxanthinifaciens CC-SAMT-1]
MELYFSLEDIDHVSKEVLNNLKSKTILFYGNMGAGKTTFIKSLIKNLGCKDEASSPTFSIVNEYEIENDKIFHFDLYRIKDIEEAYNFGIEDYLDSGHWVLIEWPEKIESLLITDCNTITIDLETNNSRKLTLN